MENNLLIQLRDVRFNYSPGRPVLDDLNLEVHRGDRIGLTGLNGTGKTTLLHLLVGLLRPWQGEINIFGKIRSKEEDFRDVRGRVGLLFQDPEDQLFCPTVAEDVAFGPFNLGWTREQVEAAVRETLSKLGLHGFENRVTYRLSFGEKRLVSLATVLAMRPEVLLLDEPTGSLDKDAFERITEVIKRLDLTLLVVSHDEAFLQQITTSRLILERGRLEPQAEK